VICRTSGSLDGLAGALIGQRHGNAVVFGNHVGHRAADLAAAQNQNTLHLQLRHFVSPKGNDPVKKM
jgi:hypothetical protein